MIKAHTPSMPSMYMPSNTRREFLLSTGALVVGASTPWLAGLAQAQVGSPTKPALTADELDSWVAIAPDGRVTVFSGKVDLGQGLEVGLAQIVAEELDVAYAKVSILIQQRQLHEPGWRVQPIGHSGWGKSLAQRCG